MNLKMKKIHAQHIQQQHALIASIKSSHRKKAHGGSDDEVKIAAGLIEE